MKKIAFLFLLSAGIYLNAGAQILIDHHCTDLGKIPSTWIDAARNNLRISYQHSSHGSQLVRGLYTLSQVYPSLTFNWTGQDYYLANADVCGLQPGVFLNDFGMLDCSGDLGLYGDLTWRDQTIDLINDASNDRNVVIWSWCGGVSDNDITGIDRYLNAMDSLEQIFPSVTFVYMTGHLDGTGTPGTLNQMNNRIRTFCATNNKILFDFADIESYDPDGLINFMNLLATDGCQYDSTGSGDPWSGPNWAANWINNNPGDSLAIEASSCGECMHSEHLNCMLKGRAFWWLLARIAGWNGIASVPETNNSTQIQFNLNYDVATQNIIAQIFLPSVDLVGIDVYTPIGRSVFHKEPVRYDQGNNRIIIPAGNFEKGILLVKISSTKEMITQKVMVY
jgi:hypothetical protein